MKEHDEEENSAGDLDLLTKQDHGDASELAHQVDDDEEGGDEVAAAPRDVHVLALLSPLNPHPDAVLKEGRDEAEPGQVGQDVLRVPNHLK